MKPHKLLTLGLGLTILVGTQATAEAQFKEKFRELTGTGQAPKKIAHFSIKGALVETPNDMPPLFGGEPPASLKGMLERLKQARLDDEVVAVVLDVHQAALGLAQLEEIHAAIRKFAAVDKDVYVHADALSMLTYAAASSASHITMTPTGDLWLSGLYGETPYLRGGLDMLGIVPDFEQCGDFKTGAESITRTGPSEAGREMKRWLFDGIYDSLVNMIADARGMKPQKVRSLIDQGLYSAEDALKAGLIDSVQHRQDFAADLREKYGREIEVVGNYGKSDAGDIPQDFFGMFSFIMQMLNPSPKEYTEPSVAIIYVEGTIQSGSAQVSPFGTTAGAFSTTIRKALDKAAEDDSVKAVVLRVDSPGGSALASEIILNATQRVADKKPLVISMGNVAGSGGYYVTCASDTIFASPNTITASIGVLGGKLVTTGLWDKLGVNWHAEKRGGMASLMSTAAPFSDVERAKIRHYMESVYEIFRGHVTEARGKRLKKPIEELAGGRVFTGAQALELGLVDKMGGLSDAIKFAANKAKVSDYDVRVIPEPPSILDIFTGGAHDDELLGVALGRAPGGLADAPLFRDMLSIVAKTDPARCTALIRQLGKLDLLNREHVLMVMPDELLFR